MGLTVTESGGGTFQSAPPGTHIARCIRIIDIGTHHGEYQGKPNVRKQILIFWELPDEAMDDGKPFIASKFYTASLSEKATLRADLESWRGKAFTEDELAGFDLKAILNQPCMLSIIDKKGGGTKVGGVMKLPKGTNVALATNEVYAFDIDDWDEARFESFSDGIKRLITESDEFKAMKPTATKTVPGDGSEGAGGLSDDIPFNKVGKYA